MGPYRAPSLDPRPKPHGSPGKAAEAVPKGCRLVLIRMVLVSPGSSRSIPQRLGRARGRSPDRLQGTWAATGSKIGLFAQIQLFLLSSWKSPQGFQLRDASLSAHILVNTPEVLLKGENQFLTCGLISFNYVVLFSLTESWLFVPIEKKKNEPARERNRNTKRCQRKGPFNDLSCFGFILAPCHSSLLLNFHFIPSPSISDLFKRPCFGFLLMLRPDLQNPLLPAFLCPHPDTQRDRHVLQPPVKPGAGFSSCPCYKPCESSRRINPTSSTLP